MNDHYTTLGLPNAASLNDVKRAYKRLALKYHPDKNKSGENIFKIIKNAYETIIKEDTISEITNKVIIGKSISCSTSIINGVMTQEEITRITYNDGTIETIIIKKNSDGTIEKTHSTKKN